MGSMSAKRTKALLFRTEPNNLSLACEAYEC